ncbi:MAG: VCBS domain-containing protein [Alphaproteobacteria bacterium]|nr:VCBS domain-containing protein [Alphaproteobacteria bacterium]
MAEMDHLIQAAHTHSPLIKHTGGVEQLQHVNPQAGPPPTACPPRSTVPHAGPPVGPPIAVHEPAPGQHIVVPVVPNQPLTFDFNPLDLKATEHGQDITLTFPDGAQITLHDIIGYYGPQPVPLELPDGTVITSSQLLEAFHLSLLGPCGGPALNEINPTAGPTPIIVGNTGFETQPFHIGGLGPGLIPDNPLPPTGFGYTNEFVKGVGGSPPSPPGPPGPPTPPPPGEHLSVPDLDTHQYFLGSTHPIPPLGGGAVDLIGNYITEVVSSSPAAFITDFWTPGSPPPAFGTHANPGGSLNGQFGTFTINAAGNYDYQLSTASEHTLSQLGSDLMSQSVNQPYHTYQAGFQDVFDVATSNGFESHGTTPADIKQIQFDFYAANVSSAAGSVDVSAHAGTTELLLTYTDAVDPAHTFQQLVDVNANGTIVATPESGSYLGVDTIVQPNDPALVTLQYLSGSGATVSSVNIEGETLNINATIDGTTHQAYAGMINPKLDGLGDTGSASTTVASQDNIGYTAPGSFNDPYNPLTGGSNFNGHFGYLFDSTSTTADASSSVGKANAIEYAYSSDAATLTGSSTADSTNVFDWSSIASIDGNTHIDGGSGKGLNVLQLESSTGQTLDFTSTLSSTSNIKNVEVFDLTDGAHSSTANSVTLTADDVFNLAHNEPTAVQNAGGAVALWINGNGTNDSVDLAGTGTTWTKISDLVTQTGQAGGSASQMVGYTEYAATTTGGQAVHVYVQNAIQNAGHVAHH